MAALVKTVRSYKTYYVECMSYLYGRNYQKSHEFTEDELRALIPADLLRWFNFKTFKMETPPDDYNPGHRSSSLEQWEKVITFVMPLKGHKWNYKNQYGNSAQSNEINNLIKYVQKKKFAERALSPRLAAT